MRLKMSFIKPMKYKTSDGVVENVFHKADEIQKGDTAGAKCLS
jgi:hypothetical protein